MAAEVIWSILKTSIAVISIWVISVILYRLFFHPLARFPGPFLAKLSDLHAVYYSIRGESHLKIWRAHRRYGPVVRLGPNKLVFGSVQALHDIYESKAVKKSVGYTALVTSPGSENTFNAVDKTQYRRKRKVIGQAFSENGVRSFEPAIEREADKFLKLVYDSIPREPPEPNTSPRHDGLGRIGWTLPVNISQRCKWFTMDIMGVFGFGFPFDLQTSANNRGLVKAVINASKAGGIVGQYPLMRNLRAPRFSQKPSTFGRITKAAIKRRLMSTGPREHPDLYSIVMKKENNQQDGYGFSHAELWGEARLFILAGSDTTAAALSATFFYLSRYPDCHQRLVKDIRRAFGSARDIKSGPVMSSLAYLRACIDEAMRMSPPVGGALGREVLPHGHTIDGIHVAGGCDVGSSLYCVHHDEATFSDSFTFRPERWLESENTPEQIALQRRAFHPFSLGQRKCVAYIFAYTELSLLIARILWYFDMRRPASELAGVGGGKVGDGNGREKVDEFQLYEHFTSIHDGPYLEFKCRAGLEQELEAIRL